MALLDSALRRHEPQTLVLERDDRFEHIDEILDDLRRLRALVGRERNGGAEATRMAEGVLLRRQTALLGYLTGGAAMSNATESHSLPPPLRGITPALLALEARFSHEKRIEKIAGILPRTFDRLGAARTELLQSFADICPPSTIGRLENARQFCEFLSARERRNNVRFAYLPELAALELALETLRFAREGGDQADSGGPPPPRGADKKRIRRAQSVVLLQCEHDVRPIVEMDSQALPARKETRLIVTKPAGSAEPVVFDVPAPVFAFLATLDQWTEQPAGVEASAFFGELAACGVLEIAG
jgi:hypothetical protein